MSAVEFLRYGVAALAFAGALFIVALGVAIILGALDDRRKTAARLPRKDESR